MNVTGAEIVVHLLEHLGVRVVAGIPGGAILPLYEALVPSPIRHILARHEQGAGFIAQGMARTSGRAGVCLATSGPGATNLVTALADAKADSVPLVALTANVNRALLGTDAFQEVDFFSLTLPVTKHSFLVEEAADLFRVLPEAFRLAESPRKGPVVVDIPKDVLTTRLDIEAWPTDLDWWSQPSRPDLDESWLHEVAAAIAGSQRPVIYAGGGSVGSWEALRAWARRESIPVATTLMGLGVMEPGDPLSLGMVGMHGTPEANAALAEADLVLALGVRFDDRATGKVSEFCPQARVVHVDIDPAELGKNHRVDWSWTGDVARFLQALLAMNPLRTPSSDFDPGPILRALAEVGGPDLIVTTDVGQHQMWAAQHFPVRKPGTFLTSGGLGTMGFGLPAAIGAALVSPGRVACITGDGSILMNLQELATLAELQLPVTVIVFHNGGLGLVRQQQELFYGSRFMASTLAGPDFPALARAFGLAAWRVGETSAEEAFAQAWAHPGPSLIEVPVSSRALVLPMVAPGAANTEAFLERPSKEAR